MARKIVIVEPEYDGSSGKSSIIYYDLIIPVILHRPVGGSKVSLSEVLKGFSPDVTHSKTGYNKTSRYGV